MKLEPSALQLRFVPLEALLLHEEDDPFRVKRLTLTLQREGKLRNPPMGITRHMVAGRTQGLDVPLEMLTDSQSLEAKNAWLKELIAKRLQANKIRLYQEPVFVFDE
jgi:hypothetical protein